MSRKSNDVSLVSLIADKAGKIASEREYRYRWAATIILVAAASAVLVISWWASDGMGSFRVGGPAPQTFYAHSRMRIVDESATRALREQRMSDIGGVLVRDRRFPEEVNRKFASLERGDFHSVLPGSLAGIMEELPAGSLERIVSVSSAIAVRILGSPDPAGSETESIWDDLSASGMSIAEQNLAFQILDHIMGGSMMIDPDSTREFRTQVSSEVLPVERVLAVGDTIVRMGETISPEMAIILRAQGYPEMTFPWNTLIFVILGVALWTSWMWWYARRREFNFDTQEWGFIVAILLSGWVAMFLSYHYAGNGLGVISLAGWAYLGLTGSFAFHLVLWGGIIGSVVTSGSSSVVLMLSVFASGITASAGYIIMRKITSRYDLVRRLFLLGICLVAGAFIIGWGLYLPSDHRVLVSLLLSAAVWVLVTLAALPLWEKLFDILTPIRLVDLTHPSHPLLKRLQIEAPGTHHHSLMVGTLAEAAAERLKLNPLLVKAGASFHDVGKLRRPQFFVENQQTGQNPHDELAPTLSALIIISHVREGLEMARQYGIPKKIRVFIKEHHGDTCLHYFYRKALNMDPDLQMDQFCYPGERPKSRESAVVMLADSLEAAVRAAASDITDPRELEEITNEVIETKISESQLSDVPLTFQDLTRIKSAFIDTLKHMYHTRKVTPIGPGERAEVS